MPKIDTNNYLRAADFEGEINVVVIDAGKFVEKEYSGKTSKKLEVGIQMPDKTIKTYSINWTSQRAIAKAYGDTTEEWVGKSIVLFKAQQPVNGVMKDIVYSKAPVVEKNGV